MRLTPSVMLCLALLAPGRVMAADATAEGATALTTSLRGWLHGLLGPGVPDLTLRAEPEGDHYRVVVPLNGVRSNGAEAALSAAVNPLPNGNWAIRDVQVPGHFAFAVPADPAAGKATVSIEHQQASGEIDPSLHGPSRIAAEATGITIATTGMGHEGEQRIARFSGTASLQPGTGGLLDFAEETTLEGWRSGAIGPAGVAAGTGIDKARASIQLQGVPAERLAPAARALASLVMTLPAASAASAGHKDAPLPPQSRAALRELVAALDGFAGALRLEEQLEGVKLELAGFGGAEVKQARIGMGGESGAGLLHAWVDVGVDGLSVPGLPPDMAALVPHRVALRPSLSGVPVDALKRLLLAAADQPDASISGLEPEIEALFARGSFTVGIEALSVAIGPAEFTGAGSVLLLSPLEYEGQARITASGFDALAKQAQGDPALESAVPFLAMARGLAKPEGNHLVWAISATRAGKLMVNGVDLSAAMGGGAPGAPHR